MAQGITPRGFLKEIPEIGEAQMESLKDKIKQAQKELEDFSARSADELGLPLKDFLQMLDEKKESLRRLQDKNEDLTGYRE